MSYVMTDFLTSLSDKDFLQSYLKNPELCMEEAGLSDLQKKAIREGDLYQIRRYAAWEMKNSLHGKLLTRFFDEKTQSLNPRVEISPMELDEVTTETDHNIVEMHDLGDDIAEFTTKYNIHHYYDHLFGGSWSRSKENEIVFIGSGIKGANHLTAEAIALIANADKVLYCVADLSIERKIQNLNNNTEDLYIFYDDKKPRKQTYQEMVDKCLDELKNNKRVCVVFYGHPGIFVWPSFKTISEARKEGYFAYMLPAVSSLDCLFADVGFDPSRHSCQIIEATDMMIRGRKPDITASVVIFQAGCVGDLGYKWDGYDGRHIPSLTEYLSSFYGDDYEIIAYEAAQYPLCEPRVDLIRIADLADSKLSGITTLYIPPKKLPPVQQHMLERFELTLPKE